MESFAITGDGFSRRSSTAYKVFRFWFTNNYTNNNTRTHVELSREVGVVSGDGAGAAQAE